MRLPVVFVISLPGSSRRDAMQRELARWAGEWAFFDAVDGRTLAPSELAAVYDEASAIRKSGRPLSLPEIGTALSHRRIYLEILRRNLDRAIVLEDDAVLGDAFFEFPFYEIGVEFDVINFFTISGLVRRRPAEVVGGLGLHRAAGLVHNTVGYLVSRDGARKLAEATSTVRIWADWPIYPTHLAFYLAVPYLVLHRDDGSTLDAARLAAEAWRDRTNRYPAMPTEGVLGSFAVLFFLKYLLYRERYDGLYDYYWRDVQRELRLLLPYYRHVRSDGISAVGKETETN